MLWLERRLQNPPTPRYGPDNHAWEGGKSFEPYDSRFNRELKREILKRDGYACQDCGHPVGRRKGARRVNVHHIDCDKNNTDPANLLALCVPCHTARHWQLRKSRSAP